ncbi:hypothetical protein J6590_089569 [Homalodisca vitripennis]|nr:hypothetical protein J6590_089569 [Homalodisca vitripennis]
MRHSGDECSKSIHKDDKIRHDRAASSSTSVFPSDLWFQSFCDCSGDVQFISEMQKQSSSYKLHNVTYQNRVMSNRL